MVAAASTPATALPPRNEDTTVLVVGPTGYIGRYVTKELISRGYKARATRAAPVRGAAATRAVPPCAGA